MKVCGSCPDRFALHKQLVGVWLCHLPAKECTVCKASRGSNRFAPHLRIGGIDARLARRFSRS
jgi:hypothetical protein